MYRRTAQQLPKAEFVDASLEQDAKGAVVAKTTTSTKSQEVEAPPPPPTSPDAPSAKITKILAISSIPAVGTVLGAAKSMQDKARKAPLATKEAALRQREKLLDQYSKVSSSIAASSAAVGGSLLKMMGRSKPQEEVGLSELEKMWEPDQSTPAEKRALGGAVITAAYHASEDHLSELEEALQAAKDGAVDGANYRDFANGYGPLHACSHAAVAELLLKWGADPSLPSIYGVRPLHEHSRYGRLAIMQVLIDAGASLVDRDTSGNPPILSAIQGDQIAAVKMLLKAGAPVNAGRDKGDGATPLHEAGIYGHLEILKVLLRANADVTVVNKSDELTVWGTVCAFPHAGPALDILFTSSSAKDTSATAMQSYLTPNDIVYMATAAVQLGCIPLLDFLLTLGLDIDQPFFGTGQTLLETATKARQVASERALLINGANPFQSTHQSRTVETGGDLENHARFYDTTRPFVGYEQDPEKLDEVIRGSLDSLLRPVHFVAARYGRVDILKWLFGPSNTQEDPANKPNINCVDLHGWTALHEAAAFGNSASVKALLELGANPVQQNYEGLTPLQIAIRYSDFFSDNAVELAEDIYAYKTAPDRVAFRDRLSVTSKLPAFILDFVSATESDSGLEFGECINVLKPKTPINKGWKYKVTYKWPNTILLLSISFLSAMVSPLTLLAGTLRNDLSFSEVLTRSERHIMELNPTFLFSLIIGLITIGGTGLLPLLGQYSTAQIFTGAIAIGGLGYIYLLLSDMKNEPRFTQLKKPSSKVRLSLWHPKRSAANILAVFLLAYEFIAYCSFAFRVVDPATIDWPEWASGTERAFIDFSLLDVSSLLDWLPSITLSVAERYIAYFYAITGVWVVWALYSGYVGFATYVLGTNYKSLVPYEQQPWIRRKFPYIQRNFVSLTPGFNFLVPLLSNGLFMMIINNCITALDCTDISGRFYLDVTLVDDSPASDSLECYTGAHFYIMLLSVTMLLQYLPTSIYVGLFFLETDESSDIVFIGRYQMLSRWVQLAFVLTTVLGTNFPVVSLIVVNIGLISLLVANIRLRPAHHNGPVNYFHTISFSAALWSSLCVLASATLPGGALWYAAILAGWAVGGLAFLPILLGRRPQWVVDYTAKPPEAEITKRRADSLAAVKANGVQRHAKDGAILQAYIQRRHEAREAGKRFTEPLPDFQNERMSNRKARTPYLAPSTSTSSITRLREDSLLPGDVEIGGAFAPGFVSPPPPSAVPPASQRGGSKGSKRSKGSKKKRRSSGSRHSKKN